MILSFILAYLLNKGVFWAKGIRSMFFLPYVSNMVAVAVVFQLMLGPRGPFYLLQKFFGVEDPIIPLLNQKWALPVVVLIAVWKGIGLNFLTYLGALQNVDKSQVEAAEIDGANKWQQIKNVVIPAVGQLPVGQDLPPQFLRYRPRGPGRLYRRPAAWSLQDTNDYKDLKGVFAMEIYNHGCELDGLYGYAPQAYDEMLRAGQKLFCVSTDDNHDSFAPGDPRCDSFGGFTMFKLEQLSYAGVIEALKKGDFYASTGPELHELYIRDGALHVACSPVEKIYVVTSGRRCLMQLAAPGQNLTEAVFPLHGDEGYIRVDCRDGQGRHAYSNAYWLDE